MNRFCFPILAIIIAVLPHSLVAQFTSEHQIMLSSSSLAPPGIYGTEALGTGLPTYAYESYYLKNVFSATYPVVSPDRDVFARFEQNQSGRSLIIRKITDGSLVKEWPVDGYNPQWFPGGVFLFYETVPSPSGADCWRINVLSGKSEKITTITGQYYPASDPGQGAAVLSPDGMKIAYLKYTDASTPVPGVLTPHVYDINSFRHGPFFTPYAPGRVNDTQYRSVAVIDGPAPPLTIRHLSWSPTGDRLAMFGSVVYERPVNRFPGDTVHIRESRQGIFVVNGGAREVVVLYETKNFASDNPDNFFFSPTGKTVGFNARVTGSRSWVVTASAGTPNSWVARDRGSFMMGFTSKEYWGLSPWSHDGSRLLYQADDRSLWSIAECSGASPIMENPPGQLSIQDAQWVDFSTKPLAAPTTYLLRPELFFLKSGESAFDFSKLLAFDAEGSSDFSRVSVQGVAADGAGKMILYLKFNSPDPLSITFSIDTADHAQGTTGRENEDGSLSSFDTQNRLQRSVTVVSDNSTSVGNVAAVIYNAPQDFVRRGTADTLSGERIISCSICINDLQSKREFHDLVPIHIVRPPLFLIHGLWSNARVWDDFPPLGTPHWSVDGRLGLYRADYSNRNNRSVATIVGKGGGGPAGEGLFEDMADAIRSYAHERNVVAIRADVVTHSMGGLIARAMPDIARPFYFDRSTLGKGRIHKLITIDTPHDGSEYADLLIQAYNAAGELRRWVIEDLIGPQIAPDSPPNPIGSGAIADMRTTSPRIAALNDPEKIAMQPPIHTFVGRASTAQEVANNIDVSLLSRWFLDQGALTFGQVFIDKEHDLVVSEPSQQGVFDNRPTRITTGDGLTHSGGFTQAVPVISRLSGFAPRVVGLLNAPRDTTLFSTNGRQLSILQDGGGGTSTMSRDNGEDPGENIPVDPVKPPMPPGSKVGIQIIRPLPGTTLNTGEAVEVEVATAPGFVINRVYLAAFGRLVEDSVPPFIFTVTVPSDAAHGPWGIVAAAVDSTGKIGVDNDTNDLTSRIELDVASSPRLDSLYARYESAFHTYPGLPRPLYVTGFFADGSTHDIGRALGTHYTSSDTTIAVVNDGVLMPRSAGSVSIVVMNGGNVDTVMVTVESSNTSPMAVAGEDRTVPVGTLVRLDGTSSSDPDGDTMIYGWRLLLQPPGSTTKLVDTTSPNPSFLADRPGYYVARLVVYDLKGKSSVAYVSVEAIVVSSVQHEEKPESADKGHRFDVLTGRFPSESMVIRFELPQQEWVRISVHDLLGREVAMVCDGVMTSGMQTTRFDTSALPNGTYLVKLTTKRGNNTIAITRKMVLVR